MGFATALSGLKVASQNLSVTGNNIANSQTAGFKESRVQFSDVYVSSNGGQKSTVGAGVRAAAIAQQFKQGNIEPTGNPLDLAISGEGFFALGDLVDPIIPDKPLEATSYTRSGAFHVNDSGHVVDDNGRYLLAFKPAGETVAEGFNAGVKLPLRIDNVQGAPAPTSAVDMKLNLNGSATPAVTPFAFTTPGTPPYIPDPKTYTHTTSITTYDSLGNAHIVATYFAKTAVPNEWDAFTFIDGRSVQPGVQADPYAIPPVAASGAVALPAGTITTTPTKIIFDDKGNLSKVSPQATVSDMARSNAALAKMKADVATAQVETDLVSEYNAENNVKAAASAFKASIDAEWTIRKNALAAAEASNIAAANVGNPERDITNLQADFDAIDAAKLAADTIAGAPLNGDDPNTALKGLDYATYAYDVDTRVADVTAALGTLKVSQLTQAANSLINAHKALDNAVSIVKTAKDNAAGLTETYATAVTALTEAEAKDITDAAAASAAGKPIEKIANTKVDFGTIDLSAINPDLKVTNMTFALDLSGSTQFSTPFTVNDLKQNGLPVGSLTGLDIDEKGIVFAKFSNGFAKPLGQVALARFQNNQALAKVGGTTWLATSDSGAPIYGAGNDSNFGTVKSSALENSNVDLSEQLVKLIVAQQAYQANSQAVSTEKSLVETVLRA